MVTSSRPSWDSKSGGLFSVSNFRPVSGQTRPAQFQGFSLVSESQYYPLIGPNQGTFNTETLTKWVTVWKLLVFVAPNSNFSLLSLTSLPPLHPREQKVLLSLAEVWGVTPNHHQEMWLKWVESDPEREGLFISRCFVTKLRLNQHLEWDLGLEKLLKLFPRPFHLPQEF